MQEEKGTGWPELLQKQGLHQVADILDKYGIGSATDVSELKDHDFIELEVLGLKPFQLNKVKRWCESAGATEVLPSSSTVTPPALTSYVALSVGDGVPNEEDATESDSEDSVSNDSGDRDADKDCVVIAGKETDIADEEVGNTIGKRAATGGTQDEPLSKKPKSTMTAEQETFVQKFKPPPSK